MFNTVVGFFEVNVCHMDIPVVGVGVFNKLDQCPNFGEGCSSWPKTPLHVRENLVGFQEVA